MSTTVTSGVAWAVFLVCLAVFIGAAQGITLTRVGHRQTPAGQSTPTAKSPSKRNRS